MSEEGQLNISTATPSMLLGSCNEGIEEEMEVTFTCVRLCNLARGNCRLQMFS